MHWPSGLSKWTPPPCPALAPLSQSLLALQPLSHPSHLQQDCEAAALPAACSGIQHLSPRYPTPAKPHSVHNQQITCLSWLMIHCETWCGGLSSCLQGYWRLDIIGAWHCWTKTKRTACHFIIKKIPSGRDITARSLKIQFNCRNYGCVVSVL